MSNSMVLSQQEVDELLRQALSEKSEATDGKSLSEVEIDALGEIGNISMGAAATALYTILERNVRITTPIVSVTTLEQLAEAHIRPYVVVDVEYTEGFLGHSLFILKVDDVKIITDIMMGGEGKVTDEDLSELHISAIAEAMNQMMGGMATSMADMFSRVVNISPPHSMIVELADQEIRQLIDDTDPELIRISFKMEIEGLMDSNIMQLMPLAFGKQLVSGALGSASNTQSPTPSVPVQVPAAAPVYAPPASQFTPPLYEQPQQPQYGQAAYSQPPQYGQAAYGQQPLYGQPPQYGQPPPYGQQPQFAQYASSPPVPRIPDEQINAQPIQLPNFDDPGVRAVDSSEFGIGLIMDVSLQVSVELGQCKKTIKEILDLNTGSILTLDKLAGEPVDIVVHGKPVAKGEVIVIDESYGIRITEILTPPSRFIPGTGR